MACFIVAALAVADPSSDVAPESEVPRALYLLPWEAGVERYCVQGTNGIVSHFGINRFSWDFLMPEGSQVLAARGGKVVKVIDTHERRGTDAPNNLVAIDHGDGTEGSYLHLRKGGARVKVGQVVAQGELIAESGNVGRSLTPHLHFHVRRGRETIPISFADVPAFGGVPQGGFFYTAKGKE